MAWPRALVLIYGIFLIVVGIEAIAKTGSVISLVASGTLGLLTLGCFVLIPTKPRIGYIGATVLALLVVGKFLPTYLKEQAIWPAGILTAISLAVVVALSAAHFLAKSKSAQSE